MTTEEAFERGASCAKDGANEYNCNFRIFATQELTKAWQAGKRSVEHPEETQSRTGQ